jgi:HAD superfamily hydrolase (TIGR01509 family)
VIKAFVFDCFGVLASDGWLPFRDKYFGDKPELMQEVIQLNRQIDSGLSTFDDFIKRNAELAHISEKDCRAQIENNIPDERIFKLIQEKLKPKYKIGMLSNAAANWLDEIFLPEQVKLFDAIALSFEMGVIKPNPRAYEIIAERLGVETSECVFIDDQIRYCLGAEEIGMVAIEYKDFKSLEEKINQLI